jgi:general secretion pathway protein D
VKVPGLGDVPVLGAVFTAYDDSVTRTDVLLTITPRVVRGWDLPTRAAREFYSGSENVYSDKPLFAGLQTPPGAQVRMEPSSVPAAPVAGAPIIVAQPAAPVPAAVAAAAPAAASVLAAAPGAPPVLAFSDPVYEVASGQDFEIRVLASNLGAAANVPLEILYNPQLLSFVSGSRGEVAADSFNASADAARGVVNVNLDLSRGAATTAGAGNAVLAKLVMRGQKPGISYLVYRTPAIKTADGELLNAQVRAARVVIK